MHRNRIRVRPSGSNHLSSGTNSMQHMSFDGTDESLHNCRAAAPQPAESSFAAHNSQAWHAQSSSLPGDANDSGEAWRYARRIASLAYDTVSGVLGVLRAKPCKEVKMSKDNYTPLKALSSPTVPPNTPHISAATSAQSCCGAQQPSDEAHMADTIELRRPRHSTFQYQALPPQPPVSESAPQMREVPHMHPSMRGSPQYQITVNQYFAAPERDLYPIVFANPDQAAKHSGASAYPSRASLLTVPSSVQGYAKRPRLAFPPAAAEELRVRKAPKTATDTNTLDVSLSNAPSAIPLDSQDNSLTVPIASLAKQRLFGRTKATNKYDAPVTAKPSAPLADAPTAKAPLFGGTATANAAAAPPNFIFGSKLAEAAPARSAPGAPAFGVSKSNSFVKAGPPAVIPDDSGFAPNADSDDDKDVKSATDNATPAKTSFSFTPLGTKPTFGAVPPSSAGAPPNPFSFSAKSAEAAPARSAPGAPAFGVSKSNSFVKAGPPAVIPDDSGFAPNADSDDDKDVKSATDNATPAKTSFSFTPLGTKPTFGAVPPSSAGAPPNPFSFSAKSAEAAPARSAPGAPAFGVSKSNSFVKAGPPAVIPDDSGFAPNADSDDDTRSNNKRAKAESASPDGGSGAFSFSLSSSLAKPPFGSGLTSAGSPSFGASTGASGTAAKPFSFANPTSTGPFGASYSSGFPFSTSKK
ncbi:hypothetical protein NXY56_004852 [Leishmania guyanensis]